MPLPQPVPSAKHRVVRDSGKFEVQVFLRTIETPKPAPEDPADRMNWPLALGIALGTTVVALLGGYGLMLLHHAIR